MRILHILNELRPSGAEVMLRLIGPLWQQHGWTPDILATGEAVGPYSPDLQRTGYRIHHLPYRPELAFFRSVTRLILAGRYDAVHIHCNRAFPFYALCAQAAGTRRIVRTFHYDFPHEGIHRIRGALARWLPGWLGCRFIAISRAVQRNERRRFGSGSRLVYNWYDTTRFRPPTIEQRANARRRMGLAPGEIALVSVGNCAGYKNHGPLIDALHACGDRYHFCYLHAGTEGADGAERRQVERLGLASRVRFLGPVQDVESLLHAADLYLQPSLGEGFGIAALEAIASGVPTLLSNIPCFLEFAGLHDSIFFAAPTAEDIHAKLDQLLPLLNDGRMLAPRVPVPERLASFSPERGFGEYLRVYGLPAGLRSSRE